MILLLKYWRQGLAVIGAVIIAFNIGHAFGVKAGAADERLKNTASATQVIIEGNNTRENNVNKTRNLSHADVDSGLAAIGLLRTSDGD